MFVLSVIEGCLPSSKAETDAEIEEERRLLYVAMTRAKNNLTLVTPWRVNARSHSQQGYGDGTVLRSSFIPESVLDRFERTAWRADDNAPDLVGADTGGAFNLLDRIKDKWRS